MRYLSEAAIFLIARVATLSTTHAFRPLVPSSHRSTAPPWAPASRIWPCVLPSDTGGVGRRRASHRRPLGAATAFVSEDLAPGATAIDGANDEMNALLNDLRVQPHFRLYSCDLLASCEYMPQELFECYTESCEIYPIDDEDVSVTVDLVHLLIWENIKRTMQPHDKAVA